MHKKPRLCAWFSKNYLGHPQPPTPFHINNTTNVRIVNNTIKHQKSRFMEMRYFWLLDHETQSNFIFHYQPGQENLGDYPTKHHSGDIHLHVWPYNLHMSISLSYLPYDAKPSAQRGCAEILGDSYYHKRTPLPSIPYNHACLTRALIPKTHKASTQQILNRHSMLANRHFSDNRRTFPRLQLTQIRAQWKLITLVSLLLTSENLYCNCRSLGRA